MEVQLPNQDNSYGLVYCTTNIVSGRKYIGKLTFGKGEWGKNKSYYLGSSPLLWRAIKKHGKENFIRETLQFCIDREDLKESEIYWIDYFGATRSDLFYNLQDGGDGGMSDVRKESFVAHPNSIKALLENKPKVHKESSKLLMRKAKLGKPWSEKMRLNNKHKKGADARHAKSVVQLEPFTHNVIKEWGCAKDAAQFYEASTLGIIDSLCRKYKTGVVGKKKRKNSTGFSWMYLEDYSKLKEIK